MQTISATELARHTRKVLDKVINQETIAIERNHNIIARIMPSRPTQTAAQVLAQLQPTLTEKQAAAWLEDSKGDFNNEIRDPWA